MSTTADITYYTDKTSGFVRFWPEAELAKLALAELAAAVGLTADDAAAMGIIGFVAHPAIRELRAAGYTVHKIPGPRKTAPAKVDAMLDSLGA